MTLNEAYELLRREVLSLRRENAKLKDGTYTDADRLAHEKEIHRLRAENCRLVKERDRYHELWQKEVRRTDRIFSERELLYDRVREENESLKRELLSLLSEMDALRNQLSEAREIIAKLKAQIKRDFETSSLPSSSKPFHKKICNSRVRSGLRPGGQSGHQGHKRPYQAVPDKVTEIPVPESILNDPDYYPTGRILRKQLIDIGITVTVTEYRTPEYRSRSTGTRRHAAFPKGIVNDCSYGENIKALAFLLNSYCNVSIDRTAELLKEITDGKAVLSKGLISSLASRFSAATEAERKRICSDLMLSPSMHVDFTSGRFNSKSVQVLLCGNGKEVLYQCRDHKGLEGINGSPADGYQQTLIHDHDKSFYHYGDSHQECLAHVLRYLKDSCLNEPELTWNQKMHDHLSSMIHEVKQKRQLTEPEIQRYETGYDELLVLGTQEYGDHPPNRYYRDGMNLLKRMIGFRDSHLYFLRHPEIDYTNNFAERELRKFKRKQHQAVTFRSSENVGYLCDCMSVIETGRLQGANIFDLAKASFST